MAIEISTVGAKVSYMVETTADDEHPSTGTWTQIVGVSEAPEVDLQPEQLDASDITDTVTSYIPGRMDPGGDMTFTLNHSEEAITAWNTMKTAADALTGGKKLWIKYEYPGATKSFYFTAWPLALGNGGISQNEVSTIPAHMTFNTVEGWA